MGRSRYIITEPNKPHFLTCTVLEWLPVFTRPETVEILLNTWRYQRENVGTHAELIFSEVLMREKLDYIHMNPVKRGYVDKPVHWRYSSARNYAGQEGLIDIDAWN